MTSQTKKFIGVSDIVALRLECKKCGTSILVDIEREDGPINDLLGVANYLLTACPTCQERWTKQADRNSAWDSEIKSLVSKMRDLRKAESGFGCLVSFEIKDEKSDTK
jgi:ribosomal protein L44E